MSEQKKAPEFEVTGMQLRDLLAPVAPLAASSDFTPVLNAVHVRSEGNYLVATATDRFRLGVQRVKLEEAPLEFEVLVPLKAVKEILKTFRPTRANNPWLAVAVHEERLDIKGVALAGVAEFGTSWFLQAGDYPPLPGLFRQFEPAATGSLNLNPAFLADFRHAQVLGEPMKLIPTGENKPVLVSIGDDFRGLIMTMRFDGQSEGGFFGEGWDAILPEPDESEAKEPAA